MNRNLFSAFNIAILLVIPNLGVAQDAPRPSPMPLWANGAPGAKGQDPEDIPSISLYRPAVGAANGAAFIICPGGGYAHLADHEGHSIALWLNGIGVTAAVLKYRLGPRYNHPAPAQDVARAIRTEFRINFLSDLAAQVDLMRKDRVLFLAVLGNIYFWFLGALLLQNILIYSKDILNIGSTQISYLSAALALSIGVGSLAAGYLSGDKIEYGLIPLGSVGITVFGAALSSPGLSFWNVMVLLGLIGFSAGFFIVPVMALIQHRPKEDQKGGIIAASNLLSFVGVGLASGAFYLLKTGLHQEAPAIFFWTAVLTLGATGYAIAIQPDSLLRLVLWFLTHSIYRIHVEGRDNIPVRGGSLFVSNHLSFVDALLLGASTDRRIRFIMFKGFTTIRQ